MHMGFETIITKYCMSCHAADKVGVFINLRDMWFDNKKNFKADVEVCNDGILDDESVYQNECGLPVKCPHCGSRHTILLDEKIGKIIAKLNEKGYKTRFSCDGEITEYGTALPYIAFEGYTTPCDIFYSLPDGWSLSIDADFDRDCEECLASIYYNPYGYLEGDDSIEWDVDAMTKWVEELPDNDLRTPRFVKHPGNRYELNDIKTAFEFKGYDVSEIHAFQVKGKWFAMLKFENGIPSFSHMEDTTIVSENEIVILLNGIDTDSIRNTIVKINYI